MENNFQVGGDGEAGAFKTQDSTPSEVKPFKLDWKDTEVHLYKGKFKHFLRRAEAEEILEWQEKLTSEVSISKDGSIPLVAESAQDEKANAEFYDKIKLKEAEGYNGRPVPDSHKSAAVKKLYERTVWIDEDADIFGEEILIHEVLGDPNNPIALIKHFLKNPMFDDAKLRRIKNTINGGVMQTDRKGGKKIVGNKPVRKTHAFYFENFLRIENVTVNDKTLVDPLIAHLIVSVMVRELTDALSD